MNRQQQIDHFLKNAHLLACGRLRAHPERAQEVQAQLGRWRKQLGRTASDPYWDIWAQLLASPLDSLESAVCADTEAAAALRNVSPMSVLITQAERTQLLREARST